jgi:hypothetical protein
MKKFKIESTYAYGDKKRLANNTDLDLFEINVSSEMHILRHFLNVDNEYKESLIGKEYWFFSSKDNQFQKSIVDIENIEVALKTKGSKFYKNILDLENPRKLLEKTRSIIRDRIQSKVIYVVESGKESKIMSSFEHSQLVGEIDCLSISQIPQAKRILIKKQPRSEDGEESGIMMNTIEGIPKEKTSKVSFILHQVPELKFYFATAFPGNLDPDFGGNDELDKKHWESLVFIV